MLFPRAKVDKGRRYWGFASQCPSLLLCLAFERESNRGQYRDEGPWPRSNKIVLKQVMVWSSLASRNFPTCLGVARFFYKMEVLMHPSHSIGWGFLEITCICNVLGGRAVSPNAGCSRCSGLSEDKSLSKVWLDLMMHYNRCCIDRHCFLSSLASPFGPNYSQCLPPFNGKGHGGWERWKWLAQTLGSEQFSREPRSGAEEMAQRFRAAAVPRGHCSPPSTHVEALHRL